MIHIEFKEPNRRCSFTNDDGNVDEWLTRADEEVRVRERLKSMGCTDVQFEDYDFQTWLSDAKAATKQLILDYGEGKEIKFRSKIWQPLRLYLTHLFHHKCAYCEVNIEVGAYTNVEHYRPKSSISGEQGAGYYWLAYDVSNYLPACPRCNSSKGTKFPLLENGVRAKKRDDDLSLELPALLNPTQDDPTMHLHFEAMSGGYLGGAVRPVSIRGEMTIDLLKLNRTELFEKRRKMQEDLKMKLGSLILTDISKVSNLRDQLERGEGECSAAKLAQARAVTEYLQENFGSN